MYVSVIPVKPLPATNRDLLVDSTKSCNHLTTAVYMMASIDYVKDICEQLYRISIECISKKGSTFLPKLIYNFSRAVSHAANSTLDEDILEDLMKAVSRYMYCSYAYSFTKFGVILRLF